MITNGVNTIQNFFGGLWKGIQNIFGGILNATDNFTKQLDSKLSEADKKVIDRAERMYKSMVGGSIWTDMFERMVEVADESFDKIGKLAAEGMRDFTAEIEAPAVGGGSIITVTGPLVTVYGSVDEERLADLIQEKLKTVLIENSSSAAPTKRIRVSGGLI